MMQKTQCLVLALFERVHLTVQMVDEVSSLSVAGVTFHDLGVGSFMGFHDWLRDSSSSPRVLGLRFTPTDPEVLLGVEAFERSYLKRQGEGLEIYFSKDTAYDPAISDDQSFQYSKVMRSSKGDLALVVDMTSLTDAETTQIQEEAHGRKTGS
jgi:hypothetical protein